ncbi:MAG: tRNA (adenosine(37)-N6)-dimethylallyltransferase MiaA [Firmicutes bacterium]|nr:tRNA (adenosine(37)-N6)-dimethylallyltransferase MiaA [Bacillota bacterium]
MKNQVIVILGPTAVGKTKLSVELAKMFDGEIINADSTQVYRGLDIATAKIREEEKEGIPHHLFDIKDVKEEYSVSDYQKDARYWIEDCIKRDKTPILVGGTGLYIKAALYDYQFQKTSYKGEYSTYSNEDLYKQLIAIDSNTTIHPNNRKRIERALDYYYDTKQVLEEKEKTDKLLYPTIFIGLTCDRNVLYDRINHRVNIMLEMGLLEEAKNIYDSQIRTKAILTPIGYKELFPYFEGKQELKDCLEEIKKVSRHYAKRQYTFFNHQLPVTWMTADFKNFQKTISEVEDYIKQEIK